MNLLEKRQLYDNIREAVFSYFALVLKVISHLFSSCILTPHEGAFCPVLSNNVYLTHKKCNSPTNINRDNNKVSFLSAQLRSYMRNKVSEFAFNHIFSKCLFTSVRSHEADPFQTLGLCSLQGQHSL